MSLSGMSLLIPAGQCRAYSVSLVIGHWAGHLAVYLSTTEKVQHEAQNTTMKT